MQDLIRCIVITWAKRVNYEGRNFLQEAVAALQVLPFPNRFQELKALLP